jgi:hypothetical protein
MKESAPVACSLPISDSSSLPEPPMPDLVSSVAPGGGDAEPLASELIGTAPAVYGSFLPRDIDGRGVYSSAPEGLLFIPLTLPNGAAVMVDDRVLGYWA